MSRLTHTFKFSHIFRIIIHHLFKHEGIYLKKKTFNNNINIYVNFITLIHPSSNSDI